MTNNECTNETMRDLLPELAHDALSVEDTARVRAHVAGCAECAAELKVIRAAGRLFDQVTPGVDTAAILRKLPVPAGRPVLVLEPQSRRRFAMPRYALAAAASLLVVASLALPTIFGTRDAGSGVDIVVDSGPTASTAPASILGASELDDLESSELEALLAELEIMEATVSADPQTDRQPITTTPEGI